MFALTCEAWYNDPDAGNSPGGLPFSHSVRCPLPCRSGSFGVADVSETSEMLAVLRRETTRRRRVGPSFQMFWGARFTPKGAITKNGNQTLCRQPELSDDRPAAQ